MGADRRRGTERVPQGRARGRRSIDHDRADTAPRESGRRGPQPPRPRPLRSWSPPLPPRDATDPPGRDLSAWNRSKHHKRRFFCLPRLGADLTSATMSEIVKKSAEVFGTNWAKVLAESHGVPGEVVEIVASRVASFLSNPNDAAAKKSFDELKEEILLELAANRERYKGGRPPTGDDVEHALIRFLASYKKAGSPDKRWILFNAFHNSFRPEFYNEGFAQILWRMVESLEYPDLDYLRRVLDDPLKSAFIGKLDLEYTFAKRLEEQGLVVIEYLDHQRSRVDPRQIARKVRDFALEEFWKADKPGPGD